MQAASTLGRFLFEFSQLEFTIRFVLANRLGLSEAHFDIVTSPYDFNTLCNVTCKVSCIKYPEEKKELAKLFNACRELNNTRVIVAHGMWTDDADGLSARHVARGSLEPKFHSFKKDEWLRLSEEAQKLMKGVLRWKSG